MSSGVVRAALASFLTENTIPESSLRGMKAKETVKQFLSEETSQDEFDVFADSLLTTIEDRVSATILSGVNSAKCLVREKVWTTFHKMRLNVLLNMWKTYFKK